MPLLNAEPTLFPADLFEREERGSDAWWAMYTLSRQEKTLMRRLHALGISYYCPIAPHRYRSPAGRMRVSYLPLFSNYVFLCGAEEQRYQGVSTGCVSQCLPVPDADRFCEQMRAIHAMLQSDCVVTVESQLTPGMPARIKSGPLTGMEGVIVDRRGDRRLLLAVDFLQQGASISVEDWEIERL